MSSICQEGLLDLVRSRFCIGTGLASPTFPQGLSSLLVPPGMPVGSVLYKLVMAQLALRGYVVLSLSVASGG